MFLNDLVDSIQGLSTEDKIERLDYGIRQVVGDSATKHSELLMRYVLNRAIVIKDILAKEMDASAVGSADAKLRILLTSIKMSIDYYETDMNTLSKKSIPNFQQFGESYFKFLTELNKSIFDASAQYSVQRTSLEWLQWDLYRDLNNTRHAPVIVKINNALKIAPAGKMSDAQAIKNIQQLKRVSAQLNILPEPQVVIQETIKVEPTLSEAERAKKYYYYNSGNACYKKSSSGDIMWDDKVNNSYCTRAGAYYYYNTGNSCHKKSFAGDVMWADKVSNSYCSKN